MMFLASFCVFVVFPFFVPSSSAHFVHFFQKMRIFRDFFVHIRAFFSEAGQAHFPIAQYGSKGGPK